MPPTTAGHFVDRLGGLQEVLGISGALLVKAFVRERTEQARVRRTNDELRQLEIRPSMTGRRFGTSWQVLQTVGPALIILAGARSRRRRVPR